jgi:hypothetical protein
MAYGIGGGGGKAPSFTTNPQFSLAKPGEITDLTNPEQVSLLDEMLQELYESHRLLYATLLAGGVLGSDGVAAGGGDVVGPDGATADRLVAFDSTTGKLIKDSGYTASTLLAAASGEVLLVEVDVSEAELETAGNPKKVVIAAPGAGIVIVPLQMQIKFDLTVNYTNAPTLHLEYDGITTDITGSIASGASGGAPETTIGGTGSASWEVSSGVGDPTNKSVGLCMNTNLTGAGSATAKVRIWYTLADFN